MKVAKWGNSLAVRLPAELVARLGLKDGDEIATSNIAGGVVLRRLETREEALKNLKSLRGLIKLPAGYRFNREELYERDRDDEN